MRTETRMMLMGCSLLLAGAIGIAGPRSTAFMIDNRLNRTHCARLLVHGRIGGFRWWRYRYDC